MKASKTEVNEAYWFSKPPNPGNEGEYTPNQTRILIESRELEKLQRLIPPEDIHSRNQILSNFDWTDSTLNQDTK